MYFYLITLHYLITHRFQHVFQVNDMPFSNQHSEYDLGLSFLNFQLFLWLPQGRI